MAFTSYDSIIAALSSGDGQDLVYNKVSVTSAAGFWYSLWNVNGSPAAAGAATGGTIGAVCSSSTLGAMPYANATGGKTMSLLSCGAGGSLQNTMVIYDRLWHAGPLTTQQTTPTTFTGVTAPDRYTNGIGNSLFAEMTAGTSAAAVDINVSYTNQDGVSGRTAVISLVASTPLNRINFARLDSGDTGIQSVQGYSTSAAPTGNFNLVMFNQSMFNLVPFSGSGYTERDMVLQVAQMPILQDNACLATMLFCSTITTGYVFGKVKMAQG